MRVKTRKFIFLGVLTFLLPLILKEGLGKPAYAQSTTNCLANPVCAEALAAELGSGVAPAVAAPTSAGLGASTISITTATGVTTTTEAAAGVAVVGDMRLAGIAAYYIWDRFQNERVQEKAKEKYCTANPYDSVCNSTVVSKFFVEGYAYGGGCSTPTFVSLPIPTGQESNIVPQPTSFCGPDGQLAYYNSGSRFSDAVFKGSFSIVTKNISTMWAVEGYAYGRGCSTPIFHSLPIPATQENNIISQADNYCGPGGVLAVYKTGGRVDDSVFNGSFSIVNKNTPNPWQDWSQAKRDAAVKLLSPSDWLEAYAEMKLGGFLQRGRDTINTDTTIEILGKDDNPSTPENESLPKKLTGLYTPPNESPSPGSLTLTPEQQRALIEHPRFEQYLRLYTPQQDPNNKCISTEVARIPNQPDKDWYKYATQVSGSSNDFFVLSYSGSGAVFDGLTPGTINLWEAKHGYGIVFYNGSDPTIQQQRDGAINDTDAQLAREAEVAGTCRYHLTAAFSNQSVANFFRQRWAGVVDNVDHPYRFDIEHIPYIP